MTLENFARFDPARLIRPKRRPGSAENVGVYGYLYFRRGERTFNSPRDAREAPLDRDTRR